MLFMNTLNRYPEEFVTCARFHGHVCPGLAIGFAAVKAGAEALGLGAAADEEIVAIVENDSCAVDAVQVLLGCTFGKGNLVFRDWGKQVFTFFDRRSGRAVRVSLRGEIPLREERHALKQKIDSGQASEADKKRWDELRAEAVEMLIAGDKMSSLFQVQEVSPEMPPYAAIVGTRACEKCGEATMTTKLVEREGKQICKECAGSS
jgi:formylmethanofuran dehydrogenase subunit E